LAPVRIRVPAPVMSTVPGDAPSEVTPEMVCVVLAGGAHGVHWAKAGSLRNPTVKRPAKMKRASRRLKKVLS